MTSNAKDRMIAGAARLIAQRGLEATSFADILELTGTPRGSLYHHFPEGKDQLVAAAVDLAGAHAIALLDAKAGDSSEEITKYFLGMWRELLVRSDFNIGCAVLAVTVESDSPALMSHTAEVFRAWRKRLAELLELGGLSPKQSVKFAVTLIASSEGAVVLSRAEKSLEPFEAVSQQLLDQVHHMTTK